MFSVGNDGRSAPTAQNFAESYPSGLVAPVGNPGLSLDQYCWSEGTQSLDPQLVDSSTAQLRRLHVRQAASRHNALNRWEARLGCPIPDDVWELTWLNFRSATENTFLWQILYQILATQKWRFPRNLATDQETWCSRCSLGIVEDT